MYCVYLRVNIIQTSSLTSGSLKWLWLPTSRPCFSKHSFAGQDMSPGWKTIAYKRSYKQIQLNKNINYYVIQNPVFVTIHMTGRPDKGTPRKRYKDTLKGALATCDIDYCQWTTQATNRMNWRRTVYQATTSFETRRRANREGKKRRRKNRDPSEINFEQTMICSCCGKTYLSRIGFINHQHA